MAQDIGMVDINLDEDWEEQTSKLWLPEENDELIGVVIEVLQGPYGNQYRILTKDNEEYLTASHKMLLSKMSNIKKGDVVRIKVGKKKPTNKGNPLQTYRVWKKA